MEFHVYINMLFWLELGRVICWEFNQGFEKSDLEGRCSETNRASLKSSGPTVDTDGLSLLGGGGGSVTATCISMPRSHLLHVEGEGGFFHLQSQGSAGHDTCAIKTSKIEHPRREQG